MKKLFIVFILVNNYLLPDTFELSRDIEFEKLFNDKDQLREAKKKLWPKIKENIIHYYKVAKLIQYIIDKGMYNKKNPSLLDRAKVYIQSLFFNYLTKDEFQYIENFRDYFLNHNFFIKNPFTFDADSEIFHRLLTIIMKKNIKDFNVYKDIAYCCFEIYSRWNIDILEQYLNQMIQEKKIDSKSDLFKYLKNERPNKNEIAI